MPKATCRKAGWAGGPFLPSTPSGPSDMTFQMQTHTMHARPDDQRSQKPERRSVPAQTWQVLAPDQMRSRGYLLLLTDPQVVQFAFIRFPHLPWTK